MKKLFFFIVPFCVLLIVIQGAVGKDEPFSLSFILREFSQIEADSELVLQELQNVITQIQYMYEVPVPDLQEYIKEEFILHPGNGDNVFDVLWAFCRWITDFIVGFVDVLIVAIFATFNFIIAALGMLVTELEFILSGLKVFFMLF